MPQIEMVCLANSRKLTGRCVAGIRADGAGWIRPVGAAAEGTLFRRDYRLSDGSEPKTLDLLRVEVTRRRPQPHQPENWLIGTRSWELLERPARGEILKVLEGHVVTGPELLGNRSDRVDHGPLVLKPASMSLALVRPRNLRWHIGRSYSGKRQSRAIFVLGRVPYDLVVTDPVWESRLRRLHWGVHDGTAVGIRRTAKVLLTVSLGEPFEGFCYKLVAGVLELP